MRRLLLFALASSLFAQPAMDSWGGLTGLVSPGGLTAWSVEKYSTSVGQHWLVTTPAGHGFFPQAQFAIGPPSSLNIAAKYGTTANFRNAALARYNSWGFNVAGEYTDAGLLGAMEAGSLSIQKPYYLGDAFVIHAIWNGDYPTGVTLPTDATKDLAATAAKITNFVGATADGFDPNLTTYVNNSASRRVQGGGIDDYGRLMLSPWNIAVSISDSDYEYGWGPGPDDCVTPDGVYHSHIGYMALISVPKLYIQWLDTGTVYSTRNWFMTTPTVYSKANLISFLKTRYSNSISALNTAWTSSYTAFDSAPTRHTGESVGMTDGMTASLSHTLANSGVSPGSLVIKVDGTILGSDPPRQPGVIVGRWPDGTTRMGGTINYNTGALVINSTSHTNYDQAGPDSTSWGTVNLGQTNIIPGSIILRLFPNDCRMSDDTGPGNAWTTYPSTCPLSPYTVTGTVNYAAGTITSLTITPAVPSSNTVQFQFDWNQNLPGTHTVTVDYDVNGFGVGTTLEDEDGTHTVWLGSLDGFLRKTDVPLAVWTDLSDWLQNYGNAYLTATIDTARPYFPGHMFAVSTSGIGGHGGCPRPALIAAMNSHADFLGFSQLTQNLLNLLVTKGYGDRPMMNMWNGDSAQADSPFGGGGGALYNYATQALRGAAMATEIELSLNGRGAGGTVYTGIGHKWWAYPDTTNEGTNFGLVSPKDNAYNGVETVTGSVACSAPINAYTCGGEVANYGDAVTPITTANQLWWNLLGSPPAGGGKISNGKNRKAGKGIF